MSRPLSAMECHAPYRAHGLLKRRGIAQRTVCERIHKLVRQAGGEQTISISGINHVLTRRNWPGHIDSKFIVQAVEELLREAHYDSDDVAEAFTTEDPTVGDAGPPAQRKAAHANPQVRNHLPPTTSEPEMLTAQAREHFNITQHPFINDVTGPQDIYLSRDQLYIRESMFQAARHSGFLAVIGESGSGKSTLRRDLVERLRRNNEPVVIIQPQTIDKRVLTAAHICDAITGDLSEEKPRASLEAKARQVKRILSDGARAGLNHALLIEEAHDLSLATLKYLKRFWEMEDGYKRLLGVVLIGQPELGDRLNEQLNPGAREVIRRCEKAYLKALNGNLEEFLAMKLKRVGLQLQDLFDKDAFDSLRSTHVRTRPGTKSIESALYPLVVQNTVIRCMNLAAELGLPRINGDVVRKVGTV